jgi:hypothetical protein
LGGNALDTRRRYQVGVAVLVTGGTSLPPQFYGLRSQAGESAGNVPNRPAPLWDSRIPGDRQAARIVEFALRRAWLGGVVPEIMSPGDAGMQITLELPEDIAQGLESKWKDLPRAALESLALEAYRSHALTAAQLRRLLGFETRMQVDAFLKEHEVYDFTAADFEQDRETLRQLRTRETQP